MPNSSSETGAGLAKFVALVANDPAKRARFLQHPRETLKDLEIGGLDDELLGFLEALSDEELSFLARLNRTLEQAGLETEYGMFTLGHL
jgi:hypothetical protein